MNGTTTKGLSTTPLSPKLLSPTSLSPTTPLREHRRSPSPSSPAILSDSVAILNPAPVAIPSAQTRMSSSVSPAHTSTPPPSPPLSASEHRRHNQVHVHSSVLESTDGRSTKSGPPSTSQQQHQQQQEQQQHQQQHSQHPQQPEFGHPRSLHHLPPTSSGQKRVSVSCEATSAAAAAAAASYTSQELAIAYSMVTSENHKTHEGKKAKKAHRTEPIWLDQSNSFCPRRSRFTQKIFSGKYYSILHLLPMMHIHLYSHSHSRTLLPEEK